MSQTIIRLPAVTARSGLSRSTLYLKIQQGTFPKNISLGERSTGWIESEVQEWIDSRISASRDAITPEKCSPPPAKRKQEANPALPVISTTTAKRRPYAKRKAA